MKILIIKNSILGETLKAVCEQQHEVCLSSHEDALETFLLEGPDLTLICECWTATSETKCLSIDVTKDIRNSADQANVVKTLGFDGRAFGEESCDVLITELLEFIKVLLDDE